MPVSIAPGMIGNLLAAHPAKAVAILVVTYRLENRSEAAPPDSNGATPSCSLYPRHAQTAG